MFSALCHDFGKPSTTEEIDGRIRSRGHERAGVAPTLSFLERLRAPNCGTEYAAWPPGSKGGSVKPGRALIRISAFLEKR